MNYDFCSFQLFLHRLNVNRPRVEIGIPQALRATRLEANQRPSWAR